MSRAVQNHNNDVGPGALAGAAPETTKNAHAAGALARGSNNFSRIPNSVYLPISPFTANSPRFNPAFDRRFSFASHPLVRLVTDPADVKRVNLCET